MPNHTPMIHATVANIVYANDKYLMVKELEEGRLVLNQPAGHIEQGEDILSAVKRETEEETGLSIEPSFLLGVYQSMHTAKRAHYIRFCFISLIDQCSQPSPQDSDIIDALWLTRAEIENGDRFQLRSPFVMEGITDFEQGQRLPLSAVKAFSH